MELEGRQNRGPYTKAKLKKIFSSWKIWLLTVLYMYVYLVWFSLACVTSILTNVVRLTMGLLVASQYFNSIDLPSVFL